MRDPRGATRPRATHQREGVTAHHFAQTILGVVPGMRLLPREGATMPKQGRAGRTKSPSAMSSRCWPYGMEARANTILFAHVAPRK